MCELISFNRFTLTYFLHRALLKSRENYLYEESNVRMRNIVQSVNQRQTHLTNNSKRLCPNDSDASSSDEDISQIDNSLQENIVKIKQPLGVCDNCSGRYIYAFLYFLSWFVNQLW